MFSSQRLGTTLMNAVIGGASTAISTAGTRVIY